MRMHAISCIKHHQRIAITHRWHDLMLEPRRTRIDTAMDHQFIRPLVIPPEPTDLIVRRNGHITGILGDQIKLSTLHRLQFSSQSSKIFSGNAVVREYEQRERAFREIEYQNRTVALLNNKPLHTVPLTRLPRTLVAENDVW